MITRRTTALVGSCAVVLALVTPPVTAAAPAITVRPAVDAEVLPRFGIDTDLDGLIDLPNTLEYVHGLPPGTCAGTCPEAGFPVRLIGRIEGLDPEMATLPIFRYEWSVVGLGIAGREEASGPLAQLRLPEGDYWVDLAVRLALPWGSVRLRTTARFTVNDVLVVAIGDSYASGEGNPELTQEETGVGEAWADGVGNIQVEAGHAAARRTTVAWPARLALAIEAADQESSVTFVSVAASSARIDAGLLGPQEGVADRGQIDQVAAMVGEREIDILLMSIGGNDVGFSRIIRGLVDADPLFDPICYRTDLANIWNAARDGEWNRSSAIRPGLPFGLTCRSVRSDAGFWIPGLEGLPRAYDRLADAITRDLWVDTTLLTEYPDPTGRQRNGGDDICGEIVGDIFSPFRFLEIDRNEQQEGRTRVIEPLNTAARDAAARHGWVFAGGVAGAFFDGHGYCAHEPDYGGGVFYRNPGMTTLLPVFGDRVTSWFRTAAQSSQLQGPGRRPDTTGTLHPNEFGHAAMARLALQALGLG